MPPPFIQPKIRRRSRDGGSNNSGGGNAAVATTTGRATGAAATATTATVATATAATATKHRLPCLWTGQLTRKHKTWQDGWVEFTKCSSIASSGVVEVAVAPVEQVKPVSNDALAGSPGERVKVG